MGEVSPRHEEAGGRSTVKIEDIYLQSLEARGVPGRGPGRTRGLDRLPLASQGRTDYRAVVDMHSSMHLDTVEHAWRRRPLKKVQPAHVPVRTARQSVSVC